MFVFDCVIQHQLNGVYEAEILCKITVFIFSANRYCFKPQNKWCVCFSIRHYDQYAVIEYNLMITGLLMNNSQYHENKYKKTEQQQT